MVRIDTNSSSTVLLFRMDFENLMCWCGVAILFRRTVKTTIFGQDIDCKGFKLFNCFVRKDGVILSISLEILHAYYDHVLQCSLRLHIGAKKTFAFYFGDN